MILYKTTTGCLFLSREVVLPVLPETAESYSHIVLGLFAHETRSLAGKHPNKIFAEPADYPTAVWIIRNVKPFRKSVFLGFLLLLEATAPVLDSTTRDETIDVANKIFSFEHFGAPYGYCADNLFGMKLRYMN